MSQPAPSGVRDCVRPGGFLSQWLDYCAPFEFPDSYGLFSLLACISAAINRRVQVNVGNEPSPFPALYVVLYGPSGAKKGGAIKQATRLFDSAVPDVTRYADDFTMEAMFGRLARDSKNGAGARGIIIQEEFADLIGGADYALRTTAMLAKLWDCRRVTSRETRGYAYEEIREAYIVILGSTSPDWMECIDPKVLAGGFLRRLLMVVEFTPKQRAARQEVDRDLFQTLAARMHARVGIGAFPPETEMRLTAAAASAMEEWYFGIWKSDWIRRDERAGHFATTIQEHVLRLAACVQVIETGDPTVLEAESWETARRLVEGLIPGILRAYRSLVPTPFARLKAIAVRMVAEAPLGLEPAELDRRLMRSGGLDQDAAVRVRLATIAEHTLVWDKEGRVRLGEEF